MSAGVGADDRLRFAINDLSADRAGTRLRVCELWQSTDITMATAMSAIHLVISGSGLLRIASMACISEAISQQSHRLE